MSIQKYHVSKNLLDFTALQNAESGVIGTSNCSHVLELMLENNTEYTCVSNGTGSTSGSAGSNRSVYFNSSDATNVVYAEHPVTVTTGADGKVKIGFFAERDNAQQYLNNTAQVWLVKGSTALPYEPYGNTWNSIPYRKYETATDTITTFPKQIIADGQSASAVIKGNMSQSGTPTPASPIYPSETGDKTANLLATVTENYAIGANGTINANSEFMYFTAPCQANETYTFSLDRGLPGNYVRIHAFNGDTWIEQLSAANIGSAPFSVTTPANTTNLKISITKSAITYHCMLNEGSTALPYQPYGYQIPILSGGVTTPVYLGDVQSERNIVKIELTGQESWTEFSADTKTYRLVDAVPTSAVAGVGICSHYTVGTSTSALEDEAFYMTSNRRLYIRDTNCTSLSAFQTYLQQQYANGTPVTVWYVLATPTTGIVNEPIRKIGNYSDSVSVTGIPTTGTAESFDIDTELKPSEVDLTYHGWHEHSDTKF